MISARKIITAPVTVAVKHVHQISATLCVISYDITDGAGQVKHCDDLYNVNDKAVMDVLMLVPAGKKVTATLQPDGPDSDTHPECTAAVEA